MKKNFEKLVSIIVPVYNVEKYLNRCIESITNQTYKNLEIILVDDGSTDNCPQICDDWAKKDKRIKVIHKANGGVSSARNVGLDNATGEYIGFVDSDDYIDITMYEKMLKLLKKEDTDICITNYYIVEKDDKNIREGIKKKPTDILEKELLPIDGIRGYTCNKLYKRKLLKNLYFDPKIVIWEDLMFNYQILSKNKITYSYNDEALYYYIQREDSALHQNNYSADFTKLDVLEFIISHLSTIDKQLAQNEKAKYILIYENTKRINSNLTKEKLEIYEKNVLKYLRDIILKNSISIKVKIKIIMAVYFSNIYNFLKGKANK